MGIECVTDDAWCATIIIIIVGTQTARQQRGSDRRQRENVALSAVCHYYQSNSILYFFAANELVCDCRLRWVFNLEKHTKNEDLREYLHRIQCIEQAKTKVQDFYENTIQKEANGLQEDDAMYYDEMAGYGVGGGDGSIRIKGEHVSNLLKILPEQLPCPQELMAPTELPLQRESIGLMDLSWRSNAPISSYSVPLLLSFAFIATIRRFW